MTRLVVIDLDTLDPETRAHLLYVREGVYDGPLSSATLAHLESIARDREARDAAKLHAVLHAPTIGAFREMAS